MPEESPTNAVEDVLGAVSACLDRSSAEALLSLRAPEALQERIEWLATQNTEGLLSTPERDEYESVVRVGNFVAILQARARLQVAPGKRLEA